MTVCSGSVQNEFTSPRRRLDPPSDPVGRTLTRMLSKGQGSTKETGPQDRVLRGLGREVLNTCNELSRDRDRPVGTVQSTFQGLVGPRRPIMCS